MIPHLKVASEADKASEKARICWAKDKAKVLGIPEDSSQVDSLGAACFGYGFAAGILYADHRSDAALDVEEVGG